MMPSTSPKCNRSLCRVFLFAFLLHLPDFSTLPRSTPRQRSLLLYSSVFASSVADKTTAVAENLSSVSFVLQLSFFFLSINSSKFCSLIYVYLYLLYPAISSSVQQLHARSSGLRRILVGTQQVCPPLLFPSMMLLCPGDDLNCSNLTMEFLMKS